MAKIIHIAVIKYYDEDLKNQFEIAQFPKWVKLILIFLVYFFCRDDTEVAGAPAMGAKSLCIPFDQPKEGISATDKCINPSCSNKPQFYTLFGRSY